MAASSDRSSWLTFGVAVFTDSSTLGIVSLATLIIVHSAHLSLKGPFPLFAGDAGAVSPVAIGRREAVLFPVVGSVMLVFMYLYFHVVQFLFILVNSLMAGFCFETLIRPFVALMLPSFLPKSMVMPYCGSVPSRTVMSSVLAMVTVLAWVFTGHWVFLDALGCGLCSFLISVIRLPNVRVATMLFTGLLLYDVFWVFYSARLFTANVMEAVAEQSAENPVNIIAETVNLASPEMPRLTMPAKLLSPSWYFPGHFSMLGFGDIVLPGLLVAHNLRFDRLPKALGRRDYFRISVYGYLVGLLLAVLCAQAFNAAQPALLYLLPCTVLPTLAVGLAQGELTELWNGSSEVEQTPLAAPAHQV